MCYGWIPSEWNPMKCCFLNEGNQCGWFQVYGIHCDVVFQRNETNVLRLVPCKGNSTKCFFFLNKENQCDRFQVYGTHYDVVS
jgi:hypothetical protein